MRLPDWIKVKHNQSGLHEMKSVLREFGLSTVCEEARCPNKAECFSRPTATFMILGSRCTRNCGFCSVESAPPGPPDRGEPLRVALAARRMGLRYVVITSVTRDDLPDGGAGHFAETVKAVREHLPGARVEVLTPDFQGDREALGRVLASGPDVFNHNVETVPRLYPVVRPQADYRRSMGLLRDAREASPGLSTKSGLMLGLGEDHGEVLDVLRDLRDAGCELITIGQYLRPSRGNLPVVEYIAPEAFEALRKEAMGMGFRHVASSPLVRSSMNADEMYSAEAGASNVDV
jgi:lipoic acid synthetase